MGKHTATPWEVSGIGSGFEINDSLGRQVAQASERWSKDNDERREITAHIVKCVNLHEELVAALEKAAAALSYAGAHVPADDARAILAKAKETK